MSEMQQWSPTEGVLNRQHIIRLDKRSRGVLGSDAFNREMRSRGIKNPERLLGEYQKGEIKWRVPVPLARYAEVEYARYYKYLPSEKYKQRNFEARGTFAIPPGVDPDGSKVYDLIEKIFDEEVMVGRLGIEWDNNWTVEWIGGAERKGTTESFRSRVEVKVVDKIRTHLKYDVNVDVSEADFGEPKEE